MSDSKKDDEESHGDDETFRFNAKRNEESEIRDRDNEADVGAGGGPHDSS